MLCTVSSLKPLTERSLCKMPVPEPFTIATGAIAIIAGTIGTLNASVQLIERLIKRGKDRKDVPKKFSKLKTALEDMKKRLEYWNDNDSSAITDIELQTVRRYKEYLEELNEELEKVEKVLASSCVRQFWKAKSKIKKLDKVIKELNEQAKDIWSFDRWARRETYELHGSRDRNEEVFIRKDYDAPLPSNIVVDFEDKSTNERKLRSEVLAPDTSEGFTNARLVVAYGMNGVGKTCVLRALALDQQVKDFYSGVFFFESDQLADDKNFKKAIAEKIEATGGQQRAIYIRRSTSIKEAIEKAREWIGDRKCLFVCDDVREYEEGKREYLYELANLCSATEGGCVLLSTAFRSVREVARVEFKFEFQSDKSARSILCTYAKITEKELEEFEASHKSLNALTEKESKKPESTHAPLENVLNKCGGLPMALAMAGKGIERALKRTTADKCRDERLREAIFAYSNDLSKSSIGHSLLDFSLGRKRPGWYTSFSATVRANLEGLDNTERGRRWPIKKLHRGLCVLAKDVCMPEKTLSYLWGIREGDVMEVTGMMENVSAIDIAEEGVRIHNVMHNYCEDEARKNKEVQHWHRNLLEGYKRQSSGEASDLKNKVFLWLDSPVLDDYLKSDLARHLAWGDFEAELEEVLLDYRWTKIRLAGGCITGLLNDYNEAIVYKERSRKRDGRRRKWTTKNRFRIAKENAHIRDFLLISKALWASWSKVQLQENESDFRQFSFQLFGRLSGAKDEMKGVKKYLNSVKMWTDPSRSYAVPMQGCLENAKNHPKQSIPVGASVASVARVPNSGELVVSLDSGEVKIWNESGTKDKCLDQRELKFKKIPAVIVDASKWRIVSMSRSERKSEARIYDIQLQEFVGKPLIDSSGSVTSVAVSENGTMVAFRFSNGSILLSKMTTKCPHDFRNLSYPHRSALRALAVTDDANALVFAFEDKTVVFWNVTKKERILRLRDPEDTVLSIAVSQDKRWVVSGSDNGFIGLWDMSSRSKEQLVLRCHQGPVSCVTLSSEKCLVISGSRDKTVRVWNVWQWEVTTTPEDPSLKQEEKVTAIDVSKSGDLIAVGLSNGEIMLRSAKTNKLKGKSLRGHNDRVTSVAIVDDDNSLVSKSVDGSLRK